MDYLEKWLQSLSALPSLQLQNRITVRGECKQHLGPRLEYATIDVVVEPSDRLVVELSPSVVSSDAYSQELIESAIFGILDVILVAKVIPVRDVKITVVSADIHPVDSNVSAFRKAGRDAGQKIVADLERL